jgi:hypothetical protein
VLTTRSFSSACVFRGVLEGQWLFYSNRQFVHLEADFPPAADSTHSLRHIINPTAPLPSKFLRSTTTLNALSPPQSILRQNSSSNVVRSVSWGSPLSADMQSSPLDCDALLPPSALGAVIRCPSVFSSSGWTDRPLTLAELMAVFDIPPQAHPQGRADKGEKVPV